MNGEEIRVAVISDTHGMLRRCVTNEVQDCDCILHAGDIIRESALFPYFDAALISFEQGICKPDLSLYEKMTGLLNVKAEECLYVGDGGSRELYAAREAGMHPVQCTWFHERAYEPHIPCPLLEEFEHAEHQQDILKYIDGERKN